MYMCMLTTFRLSISTLDLRFPCFHTNKLVCVCWCTIFRYSIILHSHSEPLHKVTVIFLEHLTLSPRSYCMVMCGARNGVFSCFFSPPWTRIYTYRRWERPETELIPPYLLQLGINRVMCWWLTSYS